jgi:hypothetical protein
VRKLGDRNPNTRAQSGNTELGRQCAAIGRQAENNQANLESLPSALSCSRSFNNKRLNRSLPVVLLGCVVLATTLSCGHKPSYSDIKVDQSGRPLAEASNSLEQSQGAKDEGAVASQSTNGGTAPEPATGKPLPKFFDEKTGQIKDLPLIPRSKLVSLQYGPSGAYETMSLQVKTGEPFDKVTAFYDAAIKSAGWRITTNDRNPDTYTWRLVKGDDDGATLQVAKGAQASVIFVTMVRLTRLEEPNPSPKP